jgi:hypothetical protein
MLFTINIESPSALEISEIRVEQEQKRIILDASINGTLTPDATLIARVPRTLLDNISAVSVESQQGSSPIEFFINEVGSIYTTIRVDLENHPLSTEDMQLVIH